MEGACSADANREIDGRMVAELAISCVSRWSVEFSKQDYHLLLGIVIQSIQRCAGR